ncbi:MAG: HDOD domain-containing protein [Pseudomonadota bacterium]
MNIPATVKTYLASSGGRFKGRQINGADTLDGMIATAKIPPQHVAKPVLLKSGKAYLMAILRADQQLDLAAIERLFKRKFERCGQDEVQAKLSDCDPAVPPPLAEPYGLRAIMDKSLDGMEQIFFATGVPGLLIGTSGADFAKLHANTWQSHRIAAVEEETASGSEREQMRRKVRQVSELPAMPGLAAELIRIRNNPYAHASELAAVIEQDPSLAAQLMRYATSPLYAYQGKLESVEQAIVRVLGMDFVLDIAFGLALGKAFNNPKSGPLGLNSFWRHAVYCAALTQTLCNAIDYTRRPPAGMGYLSGLLHNFGILLLGHLFPAQFKRLNRAVAENPERGILELERETIGVSHTELGLWLMDAWDMPKEVIATVTEHHDPKSDGDFSTYANLVYIANALLKRHGIGDGESMEIPAELKERFGLSDEQLEIALGSVLEGREGLEFMAAKMAS